MNALSFSLFGTSRKYTVGMVKNAVLAREFYPDWKVFVYSDMECPQTINQLVDEGCIIEPMDKEVPPVMNRFLIADHPEVNRFLSRDADSRLNQREADAVRKWIESDKILLVTRDHPAHVLIPAGMFGMQCKEMPSIRELIRGYLNASYSLPFNDPTIDQDFLARIIWPMFKHSMVQYDSVPERRGSHHAQPWPTPRMDWPRFVGEVVNVNECGDESFRAYDYESCPKE